MRTADIGLHDLVHALVLLGTDDARASCIVETLGFSLIKKTESGIPPAMLEPDEDNPNFATKVSPSSPPVDDRTEAFVTSPATRNAATDSNVSTVISEFLALMAIAADDSRGHALPDERSVAKRYDSVARSQPLFRPEWLSEIIYAMGSTRQPTGSVDIQRIIAELVKGELPKRTEFATKASLSLGVDLLIDFSSSMEPYWGDLRAIHGDMTKILGNGKVASYAFRILRWSRPKRSLEWLRETPNPSSLRPLVVASNFCLWESQFTPAMEHAGDLLHFLRIRRKNRFPTVALIPASPSDIPNEISSEFDICVAWDRSTSPRMIWAGRKE